MRLGILALLVGCSYAPKTAAPSDVPVVPDGPPIDPPPGAWLASWSHRKSITIRANQVAGPLTNFPVFVALDDLEIAAIAQDDGDDLRFTGEDALTPLAVDIERYDNGKLAAWVRVPELGNTADTRLYLYYGNPEAEELEGEDVWTNHFIASWHLSQSPNGADSIKDAVGDNDGDPAPSSLNAQARIDGKVGRAIALDGGQQRIRVTTPINVGSEFTLSAWALLSSEENQIKCIFSNSLSGLDKNGFRLFVNSDNLNDHMVLFETSDGSTASHRTATTAAQVVTVNAWHHIAAVVDRGAGSAKIFVNGVDRTAGSSVTMNFLTTAPVELGRMGDEYEWPGALDEIELASELRSPAWLLTSFRNQDLPSAFYDVGVQELDPN